MVDLLLNGMTHTAAPSFIMEGRLRLFKFGWYSCGAQGEQLLWWFGCELLWSPVIWKKREGEVGLRKH